MPEMWPWSLRMAISASKVPSTVGGVLYQRCAVFFGGVGLATAMVALDSSSVDAHCGVS